ncbi:MAG: polysaccharide deacetylase family protein [Chthoniobacterales bacterium]
MTGAATTSFPLLAAAAPAAKLPLVVSVHDVAPPTREACAQMISQLARHGVEICSLLVVPDYHQTGQAMADEGFVRWLRELEAAGHEIVIHGYFHQRPIRAGETWRDRLITRSYTAGEGEFYDLEYEEALHRICQARDEFVAAGLTPRGFIAPAWLLGAAAEEAAADGEMEYTTRLASVLDLRTGRSYQARSLVYSVRTGWRRAASLAWNGALARLQQNAALLRLGIHPPDILHHNIWGQILRLTDRLSAARTPTTYRDWLAEERSNR